ncbi:InlB B-repeat-containing protein [Bifidobacterium sp. ESL0728]|uniref:InlB B-repeat-containing protein n=1 Tax=Bifidobacterium sp. ESL0728 TaxID=2983220 RepID=UPI0023F82E51|nr:InlB B-repeat-containing protein [Bifidobacterium sp. ESL0728]WEV58872.1 InlB B-repeat-containing protein [Bifidobacterium sp. ESL0728]
MASLLAGIIALAMLAAPAANADEVAAQQNNSASSSSVSTSAQTNPGSEGSKASRADTAKPNDASDGNDLKVHESTQSQGPRSSAPAQQSAGTSINPATASIPANHPSDGIAPQSSAPALTPKSPPQLTRDDVVKDRPEAAGDATISSFTLDELKDGGFIKALDSDDATGHDSSATNHKVRSHDEVFYNFGYSTQASQPATYYRHARVGFRMTMPKDVDVDADPTRTNWMDKDEGFTPTDTVSGNVRTWTAYRTLTPTESLQTVVPGTSSLYVYLKLDSDAANKNGFAFHPKASIWVEPSGPDSAAPAVKSITNIPDVTVTAAPTVKADVKKTQVGSNVSSRFEQDAITLSVGAEGGVGSEPLASPMSFDLDLHASLTAEAPTRENPLNLYHLLTTPIPARGGPTVTETQDGAHDTVHIANYTPGQQIVITVRSDIPPSAYDTVNNTWHIKGNITNIVARGIDGTVATPTSLPQINDKDGFAKDITFGENFCYPVDKDLAIGETVKEPMRTDGYDLFVEQYGGASYPAYLATFIRFDGGIMKAAPDHTDTDHANTQMFWAVKPDGQDWTDTAERANADISNVVLYKTEAEAASHGVIVGAVSVRNGNGQAMNMPHMDLSLTTKATPGTEYTFDSTAYAWTQKDVVNNHFSSPPALGNSWSAWFQDTDFRTIIAFTAVPNHAHTTGCHPHLKAMAGTITTTVKADHEKIDTDNNDRTVTYLLATTPKSDKLPNAQLNADIIATLSGITQTYYVPGSATLLSNSQDWTQGTDWQTATGTALTPSVDEANHSYAWHNMAMKTGKTVFIRFAVKMGDEIDPNLDVHASDSISLNADTSEVTGWVHTKGAANIGVTKLYQSTIGLRAHGVFDHGNNVPIQLMYGNFTGTANTTTGIMTIPANLVSDIVSLSLNAGSAGTPVVRYSTDPQYADKTSDKISMTEVDSWTQLTVDGNGNIALPRAVFAPTAIAFISSSMPSNSFVKLNLTLKSAATASASSTIHWGDRNNNVVAPLLFVNRVVSGSVWYDRNHNGVHDSSERGAKGVKVWVEDSGGAKLASTVDGTTTATTDANGSWSLNNLPSDSNVHVVIQTSNTQEPKAGGLAETVAGTDFDPTLGEFNAAGDYIGTTFDLPASALLTDPLWTLTRNLGIHRKSTTGSPMPSRPVDSSHIGTPTYRTVHIIFDSKGGSKVPAQTRTWQPGKPAKATQPENPTREGYTFQEWDLDGQKYAFDSPVLHDITLTAVWTKNPAGTGESSQIPGGPSGGSSNNPANGSSNNPSNSPSSAPGLSTPGQNHTGSSPAEGAPNTAAAAGSASTVQNAGKPSSQQAATTNHGNHTNADSKLAATGSTILPMAILAVALSLAALCLLPARKRD